MFAADSFTGFPAPRDDSEEWEQAVSQEEFLVAALEEVRGHFTRLGYARGVEFVPGLFDQTLPGLRSRRWSLVRLDADSYDATRVALECLYPGLEPGGFLIVDDYGAVDQCRAAVDEFRGEHEIREPLEPVDWTCVRWRRSRT